MGKMLDYLSDQWIDDQLAARHGRKSSASSKGKKELADAATIRLLKGLGHADHEAKWGLELRECMNRCELEYARGAAPAAIRKLCRDTAKRFVPKLRRLDFSKEKITIEDGMRPSDARKLAEQFGGRWWKAGGQYAGVEYTCRRQPFRLEIPNLWMIAAVSGDPALAKSVAAAYEVPAPAQLTAKYEIREIALRHALAEDRKAEAALAAKLEAGYTSDAPPPLIEFPLGVIRDDPAMVLQGIKKVGTTMKSKWDVKKHRVWYDKQVARFGMHGWRSPGTWEECLDRTKHTLFHQHWVFSWWAVAWLNIARWRGMDDVFKKPAVFSEWVPLSLCGP